MSPDSDEPSGERIVACGMCDSELRISLIPSRGYRIVCDCPNLAVSIDSSVTDASLFDPLSGKWSSLNDV